MPNRAAQNRVTFPKQTHKTFTKKTGFTTNGSEREGEGKNKIKNSAFDLVLGESFFIVVIF